MCVVQTVWSSASKRESSNNKLERFAAMSINRELELIFFQRKPALLTKAFFKRFEQGSLTRPALRVACNGRFSSARHDMKCTHYKSESEPNVLLRALKFVHLPCSPRVCAATIK
jgi:hypothetical protein